MSFTRHCALLAASLLIEGTLSLGLAQVYPYDFDTVPTRGIMPTSDQLASPVDNIDATTGKLNLQIPITSLPRGRAGFGFDLNLTYDSHLYDILPIDSQSSSLTNDEVNGGWKYNYENDRLVGEQRPITQCQTFSDEPYFRLRVGLPDGSLHVLHSAGEQFSDDGFYKYNPAGYPNELCTELTNVTGWRSYYTTDGTFLKLDIYADGTTDWWTKTWYLYFPDGRRALGTGLTIQQLYDPNGNAIHFFYGCSDDPQICDLPFTSISDDLDRDLVIAFFDVSATEKNDTITGDGPSGNIVWTVNWETVTIGGSGTQRTYLCGSQCTWDLDAHPLTHWAVKYVQLPLAAAADPPPVWNSYEFGYSDNSVGGFGELDSMRMPSGAQYTYRYLLEGATSDTQQIALFNSISHKSISHDGIADELQWQYVFSETSSQTTNPDGGVIVHTFNDRANIHLWYRGLVTRIDEPLGTVRRRVWAQNKASIASSSSSDPNNPYIQKETATVGDASGQPSKTAVTGYTYDKNGNVLQRTDYDWVTYDPNNIENGVSPRRVIQLTYHAAVPDATSTTDDPKAYWNANFSPLMITDARRLNAVRRREISDGVTTYAVTEYDYDDNFRNGNVTAEKRWDSTKAPLPPSLGNVSGSNAVILSRGYDAYGDLTDIFNPEVQTTVTFGPFGDFNPGPYPTNIVYAGGTPDQRTWTYSWNYTAGVLNSKTDADNGITASYTYDSVGRRLTVDEASSRLTQSVYDDIARQVTVEADLSTYGDAKLQTATHYDQLGRVRLVRTSDGVPLGSDESVGIKVTTSYVSGTGGRRVVVSTPYRTTADTTLEWTCTQQDPLGRVTAGAMFSGSVGPGDCASTSQRTGLSTTAYDADWTTLTDPVAAVRKQRRDAVGRMVEVVEDPSGSNYSTTYAYDPLDNLLAVTQDSQTRTFNYSSLSRLLSAQNPENGTTAYTYFDNGRMPTQDVVTPVIALCCR